MGAALPSATTVAASLMTPSSSPTGQSLNFHVPTFLLPSLSHPSGASLITSLPGRALRDGELFEIVIQKMVDRWSGSIEAGEGRLCVLGAVGCLCLGGSALTYLCLLPGVTAIRPEDLEFPNTMTDIDYDTWMLRLGFLLWGPAWG